MLTTGAVVVFSQNTTEDEFACFVEKVKQSGKWDSRLMPLFKEQHPLYKGRSGSAIVRMRGFLMQTCGFTGYPDDVLLYIYEELESSRDAYMVAAAAIALRRTEMKRTEMATYLLTALSNIKYKDDAVCFDSYAPNWPVEKYTTAIWEIFRTFGWLGAYARGKKDELAAIRAEADRVFSSEAMLELDIALTAIAKDTEVIDTDCCSNVSSLNRYTDNQISSKAKLKDEVKNVALEDHNGDRFLYRDFFMQRPTLVAFFYTRCDNPVKCSLTVTNVARIQKLLKEAGLDDKVNLAAVTYDPGYDLPYRLKIYGEDRGIELSDNCRMLRVVSDPELLRQYFDLGVNYVRDIVNKHIIEMYLLDSNGDTVMGFLRLKLSNEEIVARISEVIESEKNVMPVPSPSVAGKISNAFSSSVLPVLMIFLPKCPLCFAAYFSFLGITGVQALPYMKWLYPLLAATIAINLFVIFRAAKKRNGYIPFYLCCAGALLVLLFKFVFSSTPGVYAGVALIFMGSVLNTIPFTSFLRLKRLVSLPNV